MAWISRFRVGASEGARLLRATPTGRQPLAGQLTIIIGLKEHLEEAEGATDEVQKHIANAPALCAFVAKIHVSLRQKEGRQ